MFNSDIREDAENTLMQSVDKQKMTSDELNKNIIELYEKRQRLQKQINYSFNYFDKLKNVPKSVNNKIEEIDLGLEKYQEMLKITLDEYKTKNDQIGNSGDTTDNSSSITLEMAGASMGALSFLNLNETDFDKKELLYFLAGPIGVIGVIGHELFKANNKNKRAAEKIYKKATEIDSLESTQKGTIYEVSRMSDLTNADIHDMENRLDLSKEYPDNFENMNDDQIAMLGTFVNNAHAAVKRLNMSLNKDGKFE